jgi:INO80 complex subunit B
VQKLLQKQSTKKKEEEKKTTPQVVGPHLRYIDNSKDGSTTISLTDGLNYPVTQGTSKEPPAIVKCHMCNEVKRYSHSMYNVPLCSLECYRKLELISAVK